jgi:hypothetical protein
MPWLNQVEINFSIVQRKVLTPNDFPDLDTVAEPFLDFRYSWETAAKPFLDKSRITEPKNTLAYF